MFEQVFKNIDDQRVSTISGLLNLAGKVKDQKLTLQIVRDQVPMLLEIAPRRPPFPESSAA